jgi:hypothetical protein
VLTSAQVTFEQIYLTIFFSNAKSNEVFMGKIPSDFKRINILRNDLFYCATSRTVSGSIPGGVTGDFLL